MIFSGTCRRNAIVKWTVIDLKDVETIGVGFREFGQKLLIGPIGLTPQAVINCPIRVLSGAGDAPPPV